jgi:hypothetical protein
MPIRHAMLAAGSKVARGGIGPRADSHRATVGCQPLPPNPPAGLTSCRHTTLAVPTQGYLSRCLCSLSRCLFCGSLESADTGSRTTSSKGPADRSCHSTGIYQDQRAQPLRSWAFCPQVGLSTRVGLSNPPICIRDNDMSGYIILLYVWRYGIVWVL